MSNIVSIKNLSKNYGNFKAVDNLNIEIAKGEIYALLGPNGAGKTTSIKMLMGIYRPDSGTVHIHKLDCFKNRAEVMKHVGYLPDEPIFHDYLRGGEIGQFAGTMRGFSKIETDRKVKKLADLLGIYDDLDEYAANYSKGMKKKLAALLALIHEPQFLIMDEPTNGLDPYATQVLHDLMRDCADRGGAVLFSTHLLEQAEKLCTRVGIMSRGRLVAEDSLSAIQTAEGDSRTLEAVFFKATQVANKHLQGDHCYDEAP